MATRRTAAKPKAAATKQAAAKAEPKPARPPEKRYSVEKLGVHCRELFGVSTCTYAGATYGMTGTYTVEEMKAHIKEWCGTEVK